VASGKGKEDLVMLENTVTTFVQSKDGGKLSSRRVLYHLPERLFGYYPFGNAVIQTKLSPVSVALCPTPTCVRSCVFCSNARRNKINCRENFGFALEIFNYFKGLGLDNILIRCVGNFEPGQDVELSKEQISRLVHAFHYGLRMSNDQIDAVTGRGAKELLPVPSRCWISALQYTAGVDPDGEVYLCSPWSQKDYSIGNINQASFSSIWGSIKHKEVAECLNSKLKSGQCYPLLCRHYYSNLAIDAFIKGLISSLPKGELEKGYGRFI